MTDTLISPLRRRMIEDMTIRKFAPRTQDGYIRAVKILARSCCADLLSSPPPRQTSSQHRHRTVPSTGQPAKLPGVRRSSLANTDTPTPQIPIVRSGETKPLPVRDFVPWRFSDACRRSALMVP